MKNRLEGVQHPRVLGSSVAGPDGGGASFGDVDKSRHGDSGGGRGRDLHVNKGVGDVVDVVVRDGGRVRLERVHVASLAWEGRRRSEGGHLAFLAHENVATLAFFTNEERSEKRD
jgi:hypothetical protein